MLIKSRFLMVFLLATIGMSGCAISDSKVATNGNPTIDIAGETYFIASLDEIDDLRNVTAQAQGAWPKQGELTISFTLAQPKTSKYRRPYVAVWIENEKDKPLRFLTLWGKQAKYHRDLRDFWVYTKRNTKQVDAVTAPTRGAGKYTLKWDGMDNEGAPMPAGDYTVHIEVVREHGTRVHMKQTITCGGQATTEKLTGNVEVESAVLSFGPAKAP